ncbi:MAG: exopolysaccharide biosynthesis protein [Pseudomonadota bacterium]
MNSIDPEIGADDELRTPVSDIVDRIHEAAQVDVVSIGDIVEALGRASFVPIMLAPALIVFSPLSGIPFLPSICGITIALVAAQLLARREYLWLPGWIMRRQMKGAKLANAASWLRRPAAFLDRHSRPRLGILVMPPFTWVSEVLCVLAGLTMPFLELLPLTSSILGAAVTLFSLSLLVRDGLVAALGYGMVCCAVWFGYTLLT